MAWDRKKSYTTGSYRPDRETHSSARQLPVRILMQQASPSPLPCFTPYLLQRTQNPAAGHAILATAWRHGGGRAARRPWCTTTGYPSICSVTREVSHGDELHDTSELAQQLSIGHPGDAA